MGKLVARIAALEQKRAPEYPPWCKGMSREELEASLEEAMRHGEEKEQREALLTASERLALRRKELEELDTRPAPQDRGLRVICESLDREYRKILVSSIHDLEVEILNEQKVGFAASPLMQINEVAERVTALEGAGSG